MSNSPYINTGSFRAPVELGDTLGHGANGVLNLKFKDEHFRVYGGPFSQARHYRMPSVRLDKNVPGDPTIDFNIPDFSVPQDDTAFRWFILDVLRLLRANRSVYIGCRGGFGRTGLVLAVLRKVEIAASPLVGSESDTGRIVRHVRTNYCSQAVETSEQAAYVSKTPVNRIAYLMDKPGYFVWLAKRFDWV